MELPHTGCFLLDGAISTNLYRLGVCHESAYDVCPDSFNSSCQEEYILNNPNIIKNLQSEFIAAGSDIIYAPTFGANRACLARFGLEDRVDEINTRLVHISREAAKSEPVEAKSVLIAGVLSPTGLQIEPYGDTPLQEVVSIYKEQAGSLSNAGVDLFAIEGMLSLPEARAAVLASREFNKPIFVTFTIDEKGNTMSGSTALSCLITLQGLGISAFGFNCSNGPQVMADQLQEISPLAKVPLIAKPDAGKPNPLIPHIYDLSPIKLASCIESLLDIGVRYVGGCCGTTPEHIAELRRVIDNHQPRRIIYSAEHPQHNDLMLSNEHEAFALDNDRIEFTDPIICEHDMTDAFLSAEEDSFDVLLIEINSIEDAQSFAENAHLAKLPVCFNSSDEKALRHTLFLYNGRAMIDTNSSIEENQLKQLAFEFGAILY